MSNQVSLSVFTLNVRPKPCISNEAFFFSLSCSRKLYYVSGQIAVNHNVTQQKQKAALQSKSCRRELLKAYRQQKNGNITKIMHGWLKMRERMKLPGRSDNAPLSIMCFLYRVFKTLALPNLLKRLFTML